MCDGQAAIMVEPTSTTLKAEPVPLVTAGASASSSASAGALFFDKQKSFRELGLDPRVLKAIMKLHFIHPSLIQSSAIPLALAGRDLLVRAKTGSGKTLAYAVPIIQNILLAQDNEEKAGKAGRGAVRAIVLVPTRELCDQVKRQFQSLIYYCIDRITVVSISSEPKAGSQVPALKERPEIIVATPTRLVQHLKAGVIPTLSTTLQMLVIDEADLVLSNGYEAEIRDLINYLPKLHQSMLMSATLSPAIDSLKRLVLHNAAVLKQEEDASAGAQQLTQCFVNVPAKDKFLMVYALLKLNLVHGKTLFFVNDINTCYRLKLFLEQFSISSAVLNSELPINTREHIVSQYNRGVFDYLIATDSGMEWDDSALDAAEEQLAAEAKSKTASLISVVDDDDAAAAPKKKKVKTESTAAAKPKRTAAAAAAAAAGDDDDDDDDGAAAAAATNVDGDDDDSDSKDSKSAVKSEMADGDADEDGAAAAAAVKSEPAAGEDAKTMNRRQRQKQNAKRKRAGGDGQDFGVSRGVDFENVGTVVNFDFPPTVKAYIHRIGRTARAGKSGEALSLVSPEEEPLLIKVEEYQRSHDASNQSALQYLQFRLADVEGFRYRVEDIQRSVTAAAVREARLKELKLEMLNSKRLKAHFEDNPRERDLLAHDKVLRPNKIHKHLQHVPQYLLPELIKQQIKTGKVDPTTITAGAVAHAATTPSDPSVAAAGAVAPVVPLGGLSSRAAKKQAMKDRLKASRAEKQHISPAATKRLKHDADPLLSFQFKQAEAKKPVAHPSGGALSKDVLSGVAFQNPNARLRKPKPHVFHKSRGGGSARTGARGRSGATSGRGGRGGRGGGRGRGGSRGRGK